jgi:chromosomal replication initiation ATPase DnaA
MIPSDLIDNMRARDDGELEEMLYRVAKEHHVTLAEMFTASRQFSKARHAAWYDMYATGHWSYPRIGQVFGVDHTTVMSGVKSHRAKVGLAA